MAMDIHPTHPLALHHDCSAGPTGRLGGLIHEYRLIA